MKLIYKGEFSGDPEELPHGEHKPGAVPFREIQDPKKLGMVANVVALVITAVCVFAYSFRAATAGVVGEKWWPLLLVGALALGAGAADYYNVFHAITQMPRGARTYLYGFHSWWYLPGNVKEERT